MRQGAPLPAGKFRHRVIVESPMSVQDNTGDPITTWLSHGSVAAMIEPLRGREALISDQLMAEMDTRIIIRASNFARMIDATWRLRHRDTIYNIVRPPAEKELAGREIEIMCSSGLTAG